MRDCNDADRARVLDMARAYLRAGRAAEPSFAFTHLSGLSLVASCFRRYPQLAPALLNVARSSFARLRRAAQAVCEVAGDRGTLTDAQVANLLVAFGSASSSVGDEDAAADRRIVCVNSVGRRARAAAPQRPSVVVYSLETGMVLVLAVRVNQRRGRGTDIHAYHHLTSVQRNHVYEALASMADGIQDDAAVDIGAAVSNMRADVRAVLALALGGDVIPGADGANRLAALTSNGGAIVSIANPARCAVTQSLLDGARQRRTARYPVPAPVTVDVQAAELVAGFVLVAITYDLREWKIPTRASALITNSFAANSMPWNVRAVKDGISCGNVRRIVLLLSLLAQHFQPSPSVWTEDASEALTVALSNVHVPVWCMPPGAIQGQPRRRIVLTGLQLWRGVDGGGGLGAALRKLHTLECAIVDGNEAAVCALLKFTTTGEDAGGHPITQHCPFGCQRSMASAVKWTHHMHSVHKHLNDLRRGGRAAADMYASRWDWSKHVAEATSTSASTVVEVAKLIRRARYRNDSISCLVAEKKDGLGAMCIGDDELAEALKAETATAAAAAAGYAEKGACGGGVCVCMQRVRAAPRHKEAADSLASH